MSILPLVAIAILAVVFFGVFIAALSRYKRCPANKLLVISGKVGTDGGQRRSALCIHGGAKFIWPVIQAYEFMSLEPISIDVALKKALTKRNIRVDVPASFTVAVSNRDGIMQNAAERLLGLTVEQIMKQAEEIIYGQLRLVIAMMEVEQIVSDRETFIKQVTEYVASELAKIGLDLINVNTRDVTDEAGYINALGQQAAATAVNEAKVHVAERNRDGAAGEATAEQDRRTKVAEANASAVQGENGAAVTVAESSAALRSKQAAALQQAETAENEAAQAIAESRANRERAERLALEVVPAEVARERINQEAGAEADRVRLHADGDAAATLARATAEAEGIFQKLSKTAAGMKLIVEAAGGDAQKAAMLMVVDRLPEIVEAQAQAISGIKFDKVTVWDGGGNGGDTSATAGFLRGLTGALPPMEEILKLAGSALPAFLSPTPAAPNGALNGTGQATLVPPVTPVPSADHAD